MKQIPLTRNHFALVDDVDYKALLTIGKWSYSDGYAVHYGKDQRGKRTTLYMHRIVMNRILGHPVGDLEVDHLSGPELGKAARSDNRRQNLRLATGSQNQAHRGRGVNNTSNYKGVSLNGKKWEARIRYADKRINLGRFDDPLIAAQMYDAASVRLYKEFAGRNFPDEATPTYLVEKLDIVLKRYYFYATL